MYVLIVIYVLLADSRVSESVTAYLKAHEDVFPEIEGRIMFVESDGTSTPTPTTSSPIIVHTCPDTGVNAARVTHLDSVMLCAYLMILSRIL